MKHRALFAGVVIIFVAGCGKGGADRLPGYVEGEFVYVSAPVSGKLLSLNVARGKETTQGDPLFELEDVPLKAARDAAESRVAQAQASLKDARKGQRPTELDALQAQQQQAIAAQKLAEVELTRQQRLLSSGAGGSQQEVDRARAARDQANEQIAALAAQLKTARLGARPDQVSAAQANADALQAQLSQAEWELGQTKQTSPAAGLVSDTLYRVGEFVASGRPVVVLLPPGNVKVRTYVPEARLSSLQVGREANVFVDGRADPIRATLRFIAPKMEFAPPVIYTRDVRGKFVALAELSVDAQAAATLHPGQPVDVAFD